MNVLKSCAVLFTVFTILAAPCMAGIITGSANFPPPEGKYVCTTSPFTPLGATVNQVVLTNPTAQLPLPGAGDFGPFAVDSFFDIFVEYTVNDVVPVTESFNTQVGLSFAGQQRPLENGVYDIEINSVNLPSLPYGILCRENPSILSSGVTTKTDLGGGLYHIDSFFDVFVELSIDLGNTWIPFSEPFHIEVQPIPEPSALILLGIGIFGLAFRGLRRR